VFELVFSHVVVTMQKWKEWSKTTALIKFEMLKKWLND
jgi:hypothetical protein